MAKTKPDPPSPPAPKKTSSAPSKRKAAPKDLPPPDQPPPAAPSTSQSRLANSPWLSTPLPILHRYRHAHRLSTPAAYSNPHSHIFLSQGIGAMSPSMAVPKNRQRVKKETLALAVRRHFNSASVNDMDVLTQSLYRQGASETSLRLKFPPLPPVKK